MKVYLPFLICFLSLFLEASHLCFAQNPTINCSDPSSQLGGFEVNFRKGCVGNVLEIKETISGATNLKYSYDFLPGGTNYSLTDSKQFTFNKAGTYSILQQGTNKDGKNFNFCRNAYVTVYNSDLKPNFDVKLLTNKKVTVNIFNGVFDEYDIDWGDGSKLEKVIQNSQKSLCHAYTGFAGTEAEIKIIGRLSDVGCGGFFIKKVKIEFLTIQKPVINSYKILTQTQGELAFEGQKGVDLEIFIQRGTGFDFAPTVQTYNQSGQIKHLQAGMDNIAVNCFRVVAVDACEADISSLPICGVPLKTSSLNKKAELKWKTDPNFSNTFDIYKDGKLIKTVDNVQQFSDPDVSCNLKYCYQIVAKGKEDMVSTSNESCVTISGADTLSSIKNTFVSIEKNQPVLIWEAPAKVEVENYYINRSLRNETSFKEISRSKTNKYTDITANVQTDAYCYQVGYQDLCKNISPPSASFCPVSLRASTTLSWQNYQTFAAGLASYVVEQIDDQGNVLVSTPVGNNQQYKPEIIDTYQQNTRYRIKAISKDGLNSYSNEAIQFFNAIVLVPDIFTPNQDGINDVFEVKTLFVKTITLSIFNRWGELIYSTDTQDSTLVSINPKSLTWSGQNLPADTYTYKIAGIDLNNGIILKTGTILLQR